MKSNLGAVDEGDAVGVMVGVVGRVAVEDRLLEDALGVPDIGVVDGAALDVGGL